MNTHVQRWAGLAMLLAVCLGAAAADAVTINYRSIGINPGVLYGEGSGPGGATATVLRGQSTIEIAGGAIPAAIGRGDEIVVDDEELYILSRDSETRLTLQAPAQLDHPAQEFAIRRAYTSIQKWVDDRRGNLVREDRREVGVLYNDGPFTVKNHWLMACIAGSRTDAEHFMWLTAAENARHKGVAGAGVVLDGRDRTRTGILIEDDYTRVDGIELKQFGTWLLPAAVTVRNARGVVLERLIVHDFDGRRHDTYGIKAGVDSDVTVRNCIIYSGDAAGIIARRKSATVRVENCTVFGMHGRGVDEGLGRLSVVNTISMGNGKADYAVTRGTQSYTMSSDGSAQGEGSIRAVSPRDQFVSVEPGREDFHLLDTSAAVDAGKTLVSQPPADRSRAASPDDLIDDSAAVDIDGTDRSQESRWDIGADEVESAPANVWYVDAAQNGDGRSWRTAFATIQQAVDAAAAGQEVWVKEGSYPLTSAILVDKPVGLFGGFSGSERKKEARSRTAHSLLAPVATRAMNLTVGPVTGPVTVNGFTFASGSHSGGGAILAQGIADFTVENCRFEGNHASGYGGAVYGYNVSGTFRGCWFGGNSAVGNGGAIYAWNSILAVIDSVFDCNMAEARLSNHVGGGALYAYNSEVEIGGCTFYGNSVSAIGQRKGGGAIYAGLKPVVISSSILWGNTAAAGPQILNYLVTSAAPTVFNSDIDQDGFESAGDNIRVDPGWKNAAAGDFHLNPGSPCINAGDPDASGRPATDFDGSPRVVGGRVDMGAFEHQN